MARILLVEDDANLLLLMEHVLRSEEHEVDLASTVQEAHSRLAQRRYDLVLTDGKLPDGTGMQVGDMASAAGMKTLVITGFAFQLPSMELGRFEYLLKPVRPSELLRAVERKLASCASPPASAQ